MGEWVHLDFTPSRNALSRRQMSRFGTRTRRLRNEFERRWRLAKPDRTQLSTAPIATGVIQLGGATMTGLVRKATLLAACGLVVAGAAMAGIPNAANSQKPCVILADFPNSNQFGGVNPGVCVVNALKVIVRDALNNPVANSDVVLDFSTCGASPGPIMLGTTQADPAITTACAGRTVLKTTNALGEVCFSVISNTNIVNSSAGSPFYTGTPVRNMGPTAGLTCCKIYASGQMLGTQLVIVNK